MAENKIPVLTEVYHSPAEPRASIHKEDPTLGLTPELVARVVAHVRPRIEDEIRQNALVSLRDDLKKDLIKDLRGEIATIQQLIESKTQDFIDKTKADFKTELPAMYQASVALAQINFTERLSALEDQSLQDYGSRLQAQSHDGLQHLAHQVTDHLQLAESEASARVANFLHQEMQAFQAHALAEQRTVLSEQAAELGEQAQQMLVQNLQQTQDEILETHQAQMQESLQAIKAAMQAEAESSLQAQLSALHQRMAAAYEMDLTATLQAFSASSGDAAKQAISQQLQTFQEGLWREQQVAITQKMEAELAQNDQLAQAHMVQFAANLQEATIAQFEQLFTTEKQRLYEAALTDIKTQFSEQMTAQSNLLREQFLTQINGDLPVAQQALSENVERMLAIAMPTLENDLRKQLTAELKELLLKVKFVLPSA